MEKNSFDLYISKFKSFDKDEKREKLLEELKVLAALSNKMCLKFGLANEILLNEELSDLKKDDFTEDDYLEALMVFVCSIENSLADYNNGISSLFKQIEKNFE